MKNILVTGGAGFIGSNFVHHIATTRPQVKVVVLDKLTYAGNLENLSGADMECKDFVGGSFVLSDTHKIPALKKNSCEAGSQSSGACAEGKEKASDEKEGARHTFIYGDICDKALVRALLAQYQIDTIVNFAAESHVDRSIENCTDFVKTNVEGTVNLLQGALDFWKSKAGSLESARFLQVSTDEVYGDLVARDGSENASCDKTTFFTESTPLAPHSPYSASKASADCFAHAFFDTYHLPVLITRCSNNYGERQFPEKLIPLIIQNALLHKKLPVYGDGKQIRDWLYVGDHCRAIEKVLESGKLGEIYNIGGHNEHENIEIVKTLLAILQKKTGDKAINEDLIEHVTDRLGHDRRYAIDPTKAQKELGWMPATAFEKGIERTVEWYLEQNRVQ